MQIRQHDILATKIEWHRMAQHFSDIQNEFSIRIMEAIKSSPYGKVTFSVVLNHREFSLIKLWYQELTHAQSTRFSS